MSAETAIVTFRPFPDVSLEITGDAADTGVIGEIARSGGQYQNGVAHLLRRLLPADATVIDAGAHVGVLTSLMARLAPQGWITAFEPAPETHAHLLANLAANALDNVSVERAALHESDGMISFSFNDASPGGSSVSPGGGAQVVEAVRLDTWARRVGLNRLDLVKMDVEGAELAALAGGAATLRRFRPVLIVECNPVALRRFGHRSWRDLLTRLRRLWPVVALVGAGGEVLPLRNPRHLELALADRGVVDLVCLTGLAGRDRAVALGRGIASEAGLRRRHHRFRPPANNFVADPAVAIHPGVTGVTGPPGALVTVPVHLENRSRFWLSSAFPAHPVHLAYRITGEDGCAVVAEGGRSPFPTAVAPGADAEVDVHVALPQAQGRYRISVTLVQEHFAWFDQVDPHCSAHLDGTVTA